MKEKITTETYDFNAFDGRDILMLLKDLALQPWNMKPSYGRLQNEMLNVRKFLNAKTKRPQRKRKFNQYKNDSKLIGTSGLISRETNGNEKAKVRRSDKSSSLLHLCKVKRDSLQRIEENVDLTAQNDREEYCNLSMQDYSHLSDRADFLTQGTKANVPVHALNVRAEYCSLCREDYSHLSDADESDKDPNPMNIVAGTSCTISAQSSMRDETSMEFLDVLRSSINVDIDVSSETSHSLSSEKEETTLSQLLKTCLPSWFNHFPRRAIPIGPRFEAEIPKWEGAINKRHYNRDDLKWLGTRIGPLPDVAEANTRGIGKGRSGTCACYNPGSVDCVRQHVREARKLLQSEISTAFSSWKFDEMGEDVSKSWTLKEQKKFETLARLNLPSEDTDFWKLAKKHFPTKSMKRMVNYYYNVYIPRRMSMETRSSSSELDSDNDQNEDYKNQDDCSTSGMLEVTSCKLLKSRTKSARLQIKN